MEYAALSASERRFLPPAVAVSTIAFALTPPKETDDAAREQGLWIPLVRRTRAPFRGLWALPGGATQWNEPLSGTANRTLSDAVGSQPGYLEQLYSFGGVERSAEAQRLVTIAYWALYGGEWRADPQRHTAASGEGPGGDAVHEDSADRERQPAGHAAIAQAPRARRWDDPDPVETTVPVIAAQGTEAPVGAPQAHEGFVDALRLSSGAEEAARNVAWFPVDALPELAFDHAEIVAHALARLRSKTEYAQVAHRFLGESFTLAQLRRVHEAVQGRAVDPANFRRQALAQGSLEETGGVESGTRHRPAKLYRFVAPPA